MTSASAYGPIQSGASAAERSECLRYLESSEVDYFLKNLVKEVISVNPEDPIVYAANFFRRIRDCKFVLSRDLSFIRESHYNRGCFVVCVKDAFSKFPTDSDVTLFEFSSFLELLFRGFGVSTIEIFAAALEPSVKDEESTRYKIVHLQYSLYFWIVYEFWLQEISEICEVKNNRKYVDLVNIINWVKSQRSQFVCPSKEIVVSVLNEMLYRGETDLSFRRLRNFFFLSSALHDDLCLKLPKQSVATS